MILIHNNCITDLFFNNYTIASIFSGVILFFFVVISYVRVWLSEKWHTDQYYKACPVELCLHQWSWLTFKVISAFFSREPNHLQHDAAMAEGGLHYEWRMMTLPMLLSHFTGYHSRYCKWFCCLYIKYKHI